MKKLKILEICPFSAGICGVWTRVLSESEEFRKLGYKVRIFSSNIIRGTHETASCKEDSEGITISRFASHQDFFDRIISPNVTYFNFEKKLEEYKPDIVITHLLHPHSFKALKTCKKLNIPCYLVTHAPFNVKRTFPLNIITNFYEAIKVRPAINDFKKIIAITRWEMPFLHKLGVKKEKIIYIPNGLPEEFFEQEKTRESRTREVLFLGRIAPVKNIECLLKAAKLIPRVNFTIVGKAEEKYLEKLKLILEKEVIPNVSIFLPISELKEKIQLIDKHKIFVLPSLREAMPQVLLEAMARGKLVISSKTDGGKEIIQDGKTGFLFNIDDSKKLAQLIEENLKRSKEIKGIENTAKKEAKQYLWKKLIKKYTEVFNQK